jgi:hypothetical protein
MGARVKAAVATDALDGGNRVGKDSPSNKTRARSEEDMKRLTITTLAALGILVGNMPLARAADTSCTTTISTGGTINGNLVVPAGANCTLNNVTVTGNVEVGKGASLSVEPVLGQRVTIGGNVQAARCNAVNLDSLGVSGSGGLISVGGNVQIEELYRLERLSGQRRPRHAIGGNLACAGNTPGVTDPAGKNAVGGNKQGQCAGL